MKKQIRLYSPDSESGSGRAKNRTAGGSTPADSGSNAPANPGGELGGAGGSDGLGSSISGPANLNDDDLGVAGLGVANIGSSATGDSGPIDPLPLTFDDDDELSGAPASTLTDADTDPGADLGDDLLVISRIEIISDDTDSLSDPGTSDDLGTTNGFDPSTAGAGLLTDYDSAGNATPGLTTAASSTTGNRANGKTVLITGASSGIGRELANLFAKDDYNVILVARSEDSLHQIARDYQQQFGIQATVISQDLADPQAPDQIYAEVQRQGLTVDVLVNNAGLGKYGRFADDTDWTKEQDLIQINSASLVHLTKLFLPDMVARNEGKILLLGSIASVVPHPLMAVYGATKAFNYSFGEALRNELKDTNVSVTVLMPPATDTDFFHKAGAEHTRAHEQAKAMPAADVAKAGYDALMAGKDKVAAGMMAKMQVATAHILPDPLVTQYMRSMLEKRDENEEAKKQATTMALVAGAVVLGGWWWLSRNRKSRSQYA